MSMSAFLFTDHSPEGGVHCEIKHDDIDDGLLSAAAAQPSAFERFLLGVGTETAPYIGNTAVVLDQITLQQVLPVIESVCDETHLVVDPTEVRNPYTDDFLVHGGSLI